MQSVSLARLGVPLLFIQSIAAKKCYFPRDGNHTGQPVGYWAYCVVGCCDDHCCTENAYYQTAVTENLAVVFLGIFLIGAVCIIISWTNLRKLSERMRGHEASRDYSLTSSSRPGGGQWQGFPPYRVPSASDCRVVQTSTGRDGKTDLDLGEAEKFITRPQCVNHPIPLPSYSSYSAENTDVDEHDSKPYADTFKKADFI